MSVGGNIEKYQLICHHLTEIINIQIMCSHEYYHELTVSAIK